MIYFIVKGHTLEHDVQTIIQVFYPNLHYYVVEEPKQQGITIESRLQQGQSIAIFYENGVKKQQAVMEYQELTIKEKKRVIKGAIYQLLRQITGIRPQWGFVTGVRPAKTINELLDKGYTEQQCLQYMMDEIGRASCRERVSA